MRNLKKYGSLAIALYPLLAIYATFIPSISIGEFILLVFSFLIIANFKRKISLLFKGFIVYSTVISLLMVFLHDEYPFVTFLFHFVSFFLIVFLISTACVIGNLEKVEYYLKKISIICVAFFVFQYFVYITTSSTVSGIIPFLPLSNGEDSASFVALQMGRDRMSSFFEEPAHFSEFLCIPLCLYLFHARNKKDFLLGVLITICIFLSTSALGAISVLIIWGMWLIASLKKGNHKILSCVLIIILVLFLPTILVTEFATSLTSRITEISGDGVNGSVNGYSSYIRVLRGYIPYLEQDYLIKITGNGLGSLESYIKTHPTQYLSLVDIIPDYLNSIQYILFGSGAIGLYLFLKQMYDIFKKTSPLGRTLLLTMFAQMFASGIYSSSVFLIAIFIASKESYKNKIEYDFYNITHL